MSCYNSSAFPAFRHCLSMTVMFSGQPNGSHTASEVRAWRTCKSCRRVDTLANLLCLCEQCHHKVHEGKLALKVSGVSGHLDQIAQRTMQGKRYLYTTLGRQVPLSTLFGYQTATLRKMRNLPKAHDADALCIATYETGEMVP